MDRRVFLGVCGGMAVAPRVVAVSPTRSVADLTVAYAEANHPTIPRNWVSVVGRHSISNSRIDPKRFNQMVANIKGQYRRDALAAAQGWR